MILEIRQFDKIVFSIPLSYNFPVTVNKNLAKISSYATKKADLLYQQKKIVFGAVDIYIRETNNLIFDHWIAHVG
jgi:hypothetical protein